MADAPEAAAAPAPSRPLGPRVGRLLLALLPAWLLLRDDPAALAGRGQLALCGWSGAAAAGLALQAAGGLLLASGAPVRRRLLALGLGALVGLALGGGALELALRLRPELLPRRAWRNLAGNAPPFRLSEPRYCVYDGPWGFRGRPNLSLPPLPTEPELVREGLYRDDPLAEPSEEVAIEYDEEGLRNPSGRGAVDLVALGDSFTFGWNLPREAAWPALLEASTGQRCQALAFNAWAPSQALAAYRAFGAPRRPRAVIATFYAGNDLDEEAAWRAWVARGSPGRADDATLAGEAPRLEGSRARALLLWALDRLPPAWFRQPRSPRPAWRVTLGGREQALGFAPGAPRGPGPPRCGGLRALGVEPTAWPAHPGYAGCLEALGQARTLAEGHGARFLCLLIPTKEEVTWPLLDPARREEVLLATFPEVEPLTRGLSPERRAAALAQLDQALRERAPGLLDQVGQALRSQGVAVLDLRPALRAGYEAGAPPYFALDSHWNRTGQARVAELVAAWLREG